MVLDAKAMTWAGQHGIDTSTLKKLKVPIYGKWYFPEIPAGVVMVNLDNGHLQTFRSPMRAGEVLYVVRDDLRRHRLGPYAALPDPSAAPAAAAAPVALAEEAPVEERPVRAVEVIPP